MDNVAAEMDKLYGMFKNFDKGTQLTLLHTTMLIGVLGLTSKFKLDPINANEGPHKLTIPDQTHEELAKDEATKGSPDDLRNPDAVDDLGSITNRVMRSGHPVLAAEVTAGGPHGAVHD